MRVWYCGQFGESLPGAQHDAGQREREAQCHPERAQANQVDAGLNVEHGAEVQPVVQQRRGGDHGDPEPGANQEQGGGVASERATQRRSRPFEFVRQPAHRRARHAEVQARSEGWRYQCNREDARLGRAEDSERDRHCDQADQNRNAVAGEAGQRSAAKPHPSSLPLLLQARTPTGYAPAGPRDTLGGFEVRDPFAIKMTRLRP